MNGDDDIDMLAAEYVIGTLDGAERAGVDARRRTDKELDAAIEDWERRLSPLLDGYAPVPPPALLKQRVAEKIAAAAADQAGASESAGAGRGPSAGVADIGRLRRQMRGWRAAAVAGYAIAAGLAAVVIMREVAPAPDTNFVAVFQDNDRQPAFIMSVDLATREVLIRPVTAKPADTGTYQLWIASEELGGVPRSLGLLDDASKPVRKKLPYDPALLEKATFGISLEPTGGSPTGRPTGKAIHGQLIPSGR